MLFLCNVTLLATNPEGQPMAILGSTTHGLLAQTPSRLDIRVHPSYGWSSLSLRSRDFRSQITSSEQMRSLEKPVRHCECYTSLHPSTLPPTSPTQRKQRCLLMSLIRFSTTLEKERKLFQQLCNCRNSCIMKYEF